MGVAKKTRKFAQVKRMIGQRDSRLKKNQQKGELVGKQKAKGDEVIREIPQVSSSLFFQYNTSLVPPYQVLVDTNFLSHTVQYKLELLETMMNTLYANVNIMITDCVMGQKYRIALQIARDERWERLKCNHKGTYADDCLTDRVLRHKVYIVATNDRDLKRRIRKIPGVPIMSVARGKYVIERLPDAPEKLLDFEMVIVACGNPKGATWSSYLHAMDYWGLLVDASGDYYTHHASHAQTILHIDYTVRPGPELSDRMKRVGNSTSCQAYAEPTIL